MEVERGKVVVITGCDSGFGQLLVAKAVEAGFLVVACHLNNGAAEATKSRFGHFRDGGYVWALSVDLTHSVEPIVSAVSELLSEASGRCLWGLVNNAGVCVAGAAELLSPKAYESTMAVNFFAPVALTYALLPVLKRTHGSRIVNVSSVDGFIALPHNAAYNASKHALESYSDTLRVEMRPWGVKVAIIQPATMRTPLAMSFYDSWLKTYHEAPEERKLAYGDQWAELFAANGKKQQASFTADPEETVADIMDALQAAEPRTRYICGKMANKFWKPLSMKPEDERDARLEKFAYPALPDALKQNKSRL